MNGMMNGVSVERAVEYILSKTAVIKAVENVGIMDAVGRILAEDLSAEMDQPPFHRSPIDGYACLSEDTVGADWKNPIVLKVVEEVDAGQYSRRVVKTGEAVRIMTGAPIPEGCDCCIRQEDTDYGETEVGIYQPADRHENFCRRGEDFKQGEVLLVRGTKITCIEVGILASMGLAAVPVFERPRVALITSGDELVSPGDKLPPGKIYNSNQYLLLARLRQWGLAPVICSHVADDVKQAAGMLKNAGETCDLVITTGGVSVGKKDIFHEALALAGAEKIFWRVLLKPGTPTIFSTLEQTPVISLSGNPFGALANFELLVRPALGKLTQDTTLQPVRSYGQLQDRFSGKGPGRRFIRARIDGDAVYLPDGLHSSGVLGSMQSCNCMIDIPAGSGSLESGTEVEVVLL